MPVAATPSAGQGTTIIVGTSDTLETLSRRYNVSPAAILQANGYRGPRALSPGQQLIIPRQTAAVAAPALAAPASRAVAVAGTASSVHVVNRGDTLLGIARRNHVTVAEQRESGYIQRIGGCLMYLENRFDVATRIENGSDPDASLAIKKFQSKKGNKR